MASLRPGRCYRRLERPYTRQSIRVPAKGYVKGVPKSKLVEFEHGTKGKYESSVYLVSKTDVQIRHNSLESARVAAVSYLERNMLKGAAFFMKIRVYPHHVIRENALATGAGADRFQQGMRASFGKPVGVAARVHKDQKMIEIQSPKSMIPLVKKAMMQAKYKLPTTCRILVEEKSGAGAV
ncbi:MAG: 50S ribosomal protein L16 [Candidatus Aenigmarchaeota archaeon]|nr:50S ribosomal protein L16 [Candidatus Aenigmarchaeota archaeon]